MLKEGLKNLTLVKGKWDGGKQQIIYLSSLCKSTETGTTNSGCKGASIVDNKKNSGCFHLERLWHRKLYSLVFLKKLNKC